MLLPIPEDVLQAQARERVLDLLLGGLGLSAAALSASFAIYMAATQPGGPSGPGRVLVAAGAGPWHPVRSAAEAAPTAAPAMADDGASLDFSPTGSIPVAPPRTGASMARTDLPLTDFAVRDGFDDTALVEAHGTLQMVRPGTVIAGAGEVLAIAHTGRGWVVTTAGGTILPRR